MIADGVHAEAVSGHDLRIEDATPAALAVVAKPDRRAGNPAQQRGPIAVGEVNHQIKPPPSKVPDEAPLPGEAAPL